MILLFSANIVNVLEMGKQTPRSLDTALPASIDHIALNNQVVGMRKTVKRTKVQLINRMVKRVRVLKNFTKGSEQEVAKKRRKAERILQEIDVIKKLDPDQVSKYALSNTAPVTELADQPSGSVTKALAQYSNHKVMQDVVGKFREKHPDWKALAAYLLSKNTGRRYKKKATKEKVTADAASAKREARDKLLNNFLEQKGADDKDVSKPANILKKKNKEKQTLRENENDELSISELKKSVETFDESDSEISEANDESSDKTKRNQKLKFENGKTKLHESESKPKSLITNKAQKGTIVSNAESVDPVNKESGERLEPKRQNKHMVIQSISLKNVSADTIPVKISNSDCNRVDSNPGNTDQVPEFLTLPQSDLKPTTRTKKDTFFMGAEDSNDSGTESTNDRNPESDGNDSGSDMEDNVGQLEKGKVAMRSTFVGSLTDNRRDKMSTWAHKHSSVRPQAHRGRGHQNQGQWGDRGHSHRGTGRGHWSRGHARNIQGHSNWARDSVQTNRKRKVEDEFQYKSSPSKLGKSSDRHQLQQSVSRRDKIGETTEVPEKLHPSWQASKQRKQQIGKIQSFQGKKTTFDDDD